MVLPLLLLLACDDGKDPDDTGDPGPADGGSETDGGSASDGGGSDGGGSDGGAATPTLSVSFDGAADRTAGEAVTLTLEASGGAPPEVTLSMAGETLAIVAMHAEEQQVEVRLPDCLVAPIEATATGYPPAETEALTVIPTVELAAGPALAHAAGPLPDVQVLLGTADGGLASAPLTLTLSDAGSSGAALAAPAEATTAYGAATFTELEATGSGLLSLSVQGDADCPLDEPLAELLVGGSRTVHPLFLPTARMGEDYAAALEIEPELLGPLPPGLEVAGGFILGVPEEAGAWLVDAADQPEADLVRSLPIRLAVLPGSDALLDDPPLEPSEDGPYETAAVELSIPIVRTSRGTWTNVAVRVAYPTLHGEVAPGAFPVLAFHHAAHTPSDIYDAYTVLHGHWASHGVIVASVDSHVNVDGQSQSWSNLSDMSDFQRAAIDLLVEADGDPSSALHGHVDEDRIVVSGHSRGGGASLLSLWRDERVLGAICFEQVSPLQTPGQDWSVEDANGDRPLPDKPVLFFSAARDMDEPWPLVDISYEQTMAHAALVTIHGANHEDTYDAGTPGGTTSTSTIARSARHAIDQHYSTAFLYRFGGAGAAAGDLAWERTLFGPEALETDLSPEGVSVHAWRHLARAVVVDAFQDEPEVNELGGENLATAVDEDDNAEPYEDGLRDVGRYDERGVRIGQWARARFLAWSDPDAELALFLAPDGEPVDLTALDRLVLRLQRDCPSPYGGACPDVDVDLEIALWDADGAEISVSLEEGMGARGIVGRHWGNSLLDLDLFAGVDLSRVEGVALSLAAADWDSGELWLDDLRFE